MLVLSRKKNESIRIGRDVILRVVEIRGDKVRLGIEAPTAVPVHREEAFLAIESGCARRQTPHSPAASGILDCGASIVIYSPGGAL